MPFLLIFIKLELIPACPNTFNCGYDEYGTELYLYMYVRICITLYSVLCKTKNL